MRHYIAKEEWRPLPTEGEDGVRGSGNPVTNVVAGAVTCACVAADDDGQRNTPSFGDRFITPPSFCIRASNEVWNVRFPPRETRPDTGKTSRGPAFLRLGLHGSDPCVRHSHSTRRVHQPPILWPMCVVPQRWPLFAVICTCHYGQMD